MKTFVLAQSLKAHDVNKLHDAFLAATLIPLQVESTETESRFTFADEVTDAAIAGVVSAYTFAVPAVPVDLRQAWLNYKNALNNAGTVAQVKTTLTDELGVLLKEVLKMRVGDLS